MLTLEIIDDLFLEVVDEKGQVVKLNGYFHFEGKNEPYLYQRVVGSERVAGGMFYADAHIGVGRNDAVKLKKKDRIVQCN